MLLWLSIVIKIKVGAPMKDPSFLLFKILKCKDYLVEIFSKRPLEKVEEGITILLFGIGSYMKNSAMAHDLKCISEE